ncbi:MAG TPA: putative molybdenum carrier protein [Sulfuricaulis sp.]
MLIEKIISGGQTGVDRAGLDVALELGIPCGGWCPKGRKAEDGKIPTHYPLQELPSGSYRQRTKRNVRDSEGTLILFQDQLTGGSAFTADEARKQAKPCYTVDLAVPPDPREVSEWIKQNNIRVLNIAGPRAGHAPGIHAVAAAYLRALLQSDRRSQG